MGRRKSVKADNPEDLRRKASQYDNKASSARDGGGSRSRRDSEDSYDNGRADRMSRAPSTKNMYRAPSNKNMSRTNSKVGSSFYRAQRPAESTSPAYKGFHLPNVETQQLEPLPTPRGGMSMNGSNTGGYSGNMRGNPQQSPMSNNGYAANGYNASTSAHIPHQSPSPKPSANGNKAASAPLTRRPSQMFMTSNAPPNSFSPQPPSLPPQPNMRGPMPGGMPNVNNSPSHQPPLPTPTQQQYHQQHQQQPYSPQQLQYPPQQSYSPPPQPQSYRPSIDFAQMVPRFHNLPQLPYVMSQQGPQAPPPFPFPFPDPAHVQQLQQQYMTMRSAGQNGAAEVPPSPAPQQQYPSQSPTHAPFTAGPYPPQPMPQQQQYPQPQQSPQSMYAQPQPGYGPPGAAMPNSGVPDGASSAAAAPAPVSPFSGSGGAPAAGAAPALPRTTSILNRRSSFKKAPPEAPAASEGAQKQPDPAAASTTSPSHGILNRVSSFKKNAGGNTSPSTAPSAVQAAQTSPSASRTAAPPQHSATAAVKAAADSQSPGILRRKSFFMSAAAAVPEPDLSPEERETVLKEKLEQREQERQRLETERLEREAAAQRLHDERLQALREAQGSAEGPTAAVPPPAATSAASGMLSPVAEVSQTLSTSPKQNVSRASSYSFTSVGTTKSTRSQAPLQQLQRRQQPPTAPPSSSNIARTASPMPEIGEDFYVQEPPKSSAAPSRQSGAHAPSQATAEVPREQQQQQQHFNGRTANTVATAASNNQSARSAVSGHETGAAAGTAGAAGSGAKPQPWHRCPSLVLYEIPLRCRRTTNEKGQEVIDDANFPVRIHGNTLRVTDAATEIVSEYPHDEFVTHRKGSTNVESKLLDKVKDVVVAGYTASVLSLDTKGLAKPTSAFDSASWMAQQRLVQNVVRDVEKMQSIYAKQASSATASSSIEAFVSIAIVKRVSDERAVEWKVAEGPTRQRTFEVVDLLQAEPKVVPFRMHNCVLFGSRLGSVEHRPVRCEADFSAALASAQSNANIVLGRLADAAAVDPENEALAKERDSVFEVMTCVVRHRKEGAVALADQLKEAPRDVAARVAADEVISSDDEDDDARLFSGFNSHNGPSNCSDMVVSCLTCVGVRNNTDLWAAALERKEEMAPPPLFNTAFGGPAYTVILASIDPTKQDSAETLSMQAGMTIKLHKRPTNGSARRLIQAAKYQAGLAQKELDRPTRPSGAEQRELKTSIRKSAAALDSLEKVLATGG